MQEPFTPGFFKRLQQLKIHTRKAYLGSRQGIHLSSRRGHGLEFSDYRSYTPGDDFRHIDWRSYARTDRLYVRQYREEQDLNLAIMIDGSASMQLPEGEEKFEAAKNLALALGYVGLTDGDLVRYTILGQGDTPRYRGPKALTRARSELQKYSPQGNMDFTTAVGAAAARLRVPGKCFVISDFLFPEEEQFAGLDILRGRNFDVSVLQILAPSELKLNFNSGSTFVEDSETGELLELALNPASRKEYAALLARHIERLEKYCQKSGIAHILLSSDEDLSDVVLSRLPAAGVLK